jgi:hypothetical protein
MDPKAKRELIEEGRQRQDVAYKYSIVLGLDMSSAAAMLKDYTLRLHTLLTSCSDCIRNYHMGRKSYLKYLHEYVYRVDFVKAEETYIIVGNWTTKNESIVLLAGCYNSTSIASIQDCNQQRTFSMQHRQRNGHKVYWRRTTQLHSWQSTKHFAAQSFTHQRRNCRGTSIMFSKGYKGRKS